MIERGHLTSEDYVKLQQDERTGIDRIAEKLIGRKNELSIDEAASYVYVGGDVR
jgi:hypothetical protein